jgi:hypothetical protein
MRNANFMKTPFTFLLCSLIAGPLFAQYSQAQYAQNVTITFNNNDNGRYGNAYQVVIDGRSYSSNNSINNNGRWNTDNSGSYARPITLQLQTGQHSLQVYDMRRNNRYDNGNTWNSSPVYSSSFLLRQGYDANIAITSNGRVQITETPGGYNYGRRNGDRRERDGDGDGDDDDRGNGGYHRNGGYNNNGGYNGNNGGYNGGYNRYRAPMADYQFSQLLQTVRGKWFQSGKVNAEKNAFNSGSYFSTFQVRQLLQLINSESNRLELAELSYRIVSDPGNFTQLYDLFNKRNRNELEKYIRGSRY